MEMTFDRGQGTTIRYKLSTEPHEAMYWGTYRLKKSHIKLLDKFSRQEAAEIRQEIYDDILLTEPNI